MKNTFKRIAVIALAVLMCVSAVMPAFAAGNACPGVGKTHTAYNCTYQEVSKQEATCETAGSVIGKCTTCGVIFSVSQTDALGHDYGTTTQAVCGYAASRTCKRCDKVDNVGAVLEHLYTAWTLAEGECGVKGARVTRECVYCGDVQARKLGDGTAEMGKENHVYSLVSYVEPATCIDKGLATYECVVAGCDEVKTVEIAVTTANTTKHTYREWTAADGKDVNAKPASCSEKGRKSMICSVEGCGDVVVVVVEKVVPCDVDYFKAVARKCETAGNAAYWLCPDCGVYYEALDADYNAETDEAIAWTKEIQESRAILSKKPVIAAVHDGLTTSATAIDREYLPTCDTDGLVIYSCKETDCEKVGELTLAKFDKHVYYNDVKTVAEKAAIINALNNNKNYTKNWTDAAIEAEWVKLGDVKTGYGNNKVFKNYTPRDCEKNATVTYLCLNFTYSYDEGKYYFAYDAKCGSCNAATETVLTGADYDKTGHKFADKYPVTYSQIGDNLGTTDVEETNAVLAGTQAYKWDGPKASCKTVGRKINYCVNEHKVGNTYVACGETQTVGVAALGHDYVAYDATKIDDTATYILKNDDPTGAELKIIVAADEVTCVKDGKAYTVCTRCNDVQAVNVTSAGTEHKWTYVTGLGVDISTLSDTEKAAYTPNCITAVTGVYRKCTETKCKANSTLEAVTLPATGHKYIDTTDAEVLKTLLNMTEGQTTADVKYVKAATCENGATFQLYCTNPNCDFPTTFEYNEGFGGGHVKTYIANTAIAATCTANGNSNKWYCANENCDYFGYINNAGVLTLKTGVTVDTLKSDDVYGAKHKIWDAKTEEYVQVTYKHVPDVNVSASEKPAEVEAPVVNGEVVRFVAIEGTSYVWVYKYTSDDHKVKSVDAGYLLCVDCEYEINAEENKNEWKDAFFGTACSNYLDISKTQSCESVGYTYKICSKCFDVKDGSISGFVPALKHTYYFTDGNKIDTTKWFGKGAEGDADYVAPLKGSTTATNEGLNYVAPTCTNAGYAIDNCKTCDKVVTVAVKATGHINKNGDVLDSSCLDVKFPRDCAICDVKNVPYGHDWNENAICKVCNAAK